MKATGKSKIVAEFLPIQHLLVVDDDNITDFIIEGVIQYFTDVTQYKFETNGWKALEYLAHCKRLGSFPDLIMLDLKMPLMSGTEFLLRYEHLFYEKFPKTKLIVVSNHYDNYREELDHFGSINLILNKPLNKQKFQIIQNTLFE